jgi:hypothetical protein
MGIVAPSEVSSFSSVPGTGVTATQGGNIHATPRAKSADDRDTHPNNDGDYEG